MRALQTRRNRLAQDHRGPLAAGAVVPVAVVASVEQQDVGRASPERRQCVEEELAQELRRARALSVQQNEQPARVPTRQDEDLMQVVVREPAVKREAEEPRAACRVVPGAATAARDSDDDHG